MPFDHTQEQSQEEQQRAQRLSLKSTRPPTEVPGYQLQRFLGSGAYGEVWVGVDQNTGRRVAIKFYLHRGGLDWSLLSQEVEKLVFLTADRYVVQLMDVGWQATPPYYVMEYIENGSLEDLLREHGPLPTGSAVELFHDMAVGLMHAHRKGVLHCDLKPANILLDQDDRPRLADFGQSRLSHEQTPALGTLFYMAPEQADLQALPDARWDVYALGAILYCMLTGQPPHRHDEAITHIDTASDLPERLARYRQLIGTAPPPDKHRQVPGMDRSLAEIIDHCLAVDPEERFGNVQEVLDALKNRQQTRARRPLLTLGLVGPMLLLLVMVVFGWRGYSEAVGETDQQLTEKTREVNDWASQFAAGLVAHEVDRYFRTVEQVAADPELHELFLEVVEHPELAGLLAQLDDPDRNHQLQELRQQFVTHPDRQALQHRVERLMFRQETSEAASWFITDAEGTHVAAVFDSHFERSPIGRNFGYRTYFHGGPEDLIEMVQEDGRRMPRYHRPGPDQQITDTHISALFPSTATNTWKVAFSTPIFHEGQFRGIVALTVEMGHFLRFQDREDKYAMLVDGRQGPHQGAILQHPLFDRLLNAQNRLPARFSQYRVRLDDVDNGAKLYRDPLGQDPAGKAYDRDWIVAKAPVRLLQPRTDANGDRTTLATGLYVLVLADHKAAIAPSHHLGDRLLGLGLWALAVVIVVVIALWYFVLRMLGEPPRAPRRSPLPRSDPTPLQEMTTLAR